MHDVNGNARDFSQGDGAMYGFGFGQRGAGERVIDGRGLAFGQRLTNHHVDHAAVLGVHANERAVLGRLLQGTKNSGVIHHKHVGVRHEELEAGYAFAHHVVHVFQACFGKIGDNHVQAIIDARLGLRLFPPGVERIAHLGAAGLDGKVDDGCGAADGRRAGAGFEIVARCGTTERHVEVRVRVDAARQQQHAGGVQHLVARLGWNPGPHFFYRAAVDQHIRGESLLRRHHRTVFNEDSH